MQGRHAGRARIVRDLNDLSQIEVGDVVVLETASPAAGVLLEVAGAVVAEEGGSLSNLATLAREGGVPCIIGVTGATHSIRDGDEVVVDANTGIVSVVRAAVSA